MSAPAWMPLYVGDYLADTGHLSTLEHGAYMLLIMHYWQHGGLPDDDGKLARIVRMPISDWQGVRGTLSDLFAEGWHHKRIDAEMAKAEDTINKRKAAGQAGAYARYGKRMPDAQQTDTPSPSPSPSEKVATQPSARAAEISKSPEASAPDPLAIPVALRRGERDRGWFDQVEAECRDAAGLENDPSPALLDTSPIVALIDQGYDFARDILPKLRAAKGAKKHGRSWAYYVPAIIEGKAANGKIEPKVTAASGPLQVWLTEDDPRWPAASDAWAKARGKPPPILSGTHGNIGRGWHFPPEFVPDIAA